MVEAKLVIPDEMLQYLNEVAPAGATVTAPSPSLLEWRQPAELASVAGRLSSPSPVASLPMFSPPADHHHQQQQQQPRSLPPRATPAQAQPPPSHFDVDYSMEEILPRYDDPYMSNNNPTANHHPHQHHQQFQYAPGGGSSFVQCGHLSGYFHRTDHSAALCCRFVDAVTVAAAAAANFEIQCRDISQSQLSPAIRQQQQHNMLMSTTASASMSMQTPAVESVALATTNPVAQPTTPQTDCLHLSGMRQDAYQRTLEYVQSCQNWTTSSLSAAARVEEVAAVTSSTHPSTASADAAIADVAASAATAAAGVVTTSTSNMIINDLTTSLSSLIEENRCLLQMIQ